MPSGKRKNKKKSRIGDESQRATPRFDGTERLLMRFYEPLVLQFVLNSTPGSHTVRQPFDSQDESELYDCDLRRSFVDKLAYICDYQKGGATVTAIALQDTPETVVFWIAANEDVSENVIPFLKEILGNLTGLDKAAEDVRAVMVDRIFERAVKFGMKRVESYWGLLQEHLKKCLKALGKSDEDHKMMAWLTSLQSYCDDMSQLCRFSYETRTSPSMKELARRSPKISALANMVDSNCFSQVRHYIGRLSSYMKAAKTLVAAAERFPAFFDYPEIKCCPSPKQAEKPPMMDSLTTLNGIVVRMLPMDDERVPDIQKALQSMDTKYHIYKRLVNEYQNPRFLPRVHAELILLEHFYMNQYIFVDRDKYIGCSKPACYCCYHYICAHPGDFVRPACHNKTYLNWRPPDVEDDEQNGPAKNHQRDILNTMLKPIRRDILRQIEEKRGPSCSHHDSTTGITLSVAPDSPCIAEAELDDIT